MGPAAADPPSTAIEDLCCRLYGDCSCRGRALGPCEALRDLLAAHGGDVERAAAAEARRLDRGTAFGPGRAATPYHQRES